MTCRRRLPGRRAADLVSLEVSGRRFEASIGSDDKGAALEVFLAAGRPGSEINVLLGDLGVAISLALQHGCPAERLAHAFLRNADGSPAGPAAAAMDEIVGPGLRRDDGDPRVRGDKGED